MRMQYIQPTTEVVSIRLSGSVLEDIGMGDDSEVGTSMDAKEQTFDSWDEEPSTRPRNVNLWDE